MNVIKKDIFYSILINSLNILYPLFTYPYISKKIGISNFGNLDFSLSYMNFFLMLASFGIITYGMRSISLSQLEERKEIFYNLFIVNVITTFLALVCYYILIFVVDSLYINKKIILIFSFIIILRVFSFEWYFRGIQELKILTIRTVLSKVFSIIFIYFFIKTNKDYFKYAYILVLSDFLISILNISYLYKFEQKNLLRSKINIKKIKKHFKNMFPFFIIVFFTAFYRQIDVILLGNLKGNIEVAYFSVAKKLISVFISFYTAIFYVTLTKIYDYKEKEIIEFNSNILNTTYLLTLPLTAGIYLSSKEIIVWLFGIEFTKSIFLLKIMCFNIFFISINLFMSMQILLADGKEKVVSKIVVISGTLSLISNFVLISKYGTVGTCLANLLVEIIGSFIYVYNIKKYKRINLISVYFFKYLILSILIYIFIYILKSKLNMINIASLFFEVLSFMVLYFIILYFLKDKTFFNIIKKERF